jgi:hypothetical protein
METHLGTNPIPLFVLLPIWVVAAASIVWTILKTQVKLWRRLALAGGGLLALFGFAVLLVGFYYKISPTFANTFRFYVYSALAPNKRDPFNNQNSNQSVIMMRSVGYSHGELRLQYNPNPDYPTIVYLFTPGKIITADLKNDTLTVPTKESGSMPRILHSSLWWALTQSINNEVSSVE